MKFRKLREKTITIVAKDGCQLSARWWPGKDASERSVVLSPGMAAPQGYLRWFATYLAGQGWGVLTFDYRGTGTSRNEQLNSVFTIDDWVDLDLPAVVSEVKHRAKPQFLAVVAHSVSGQLFGQSPVRHHVDGAVFISSQRGIPKLFKGMARLRIHYAYTVFPLLIHMFGELPISRFTLPQQCPKQGLWPWIRWGQSGTFTDMSGINVESRFADYKGPLVTITIADDRDYASAASVKALANLYSNADIQFKELIPQDYGLESIGHFGFFHRRAPQPMWAQVEAWLRHLHHTTSLAKAHSAS